MSGNGSRNNELECPLSDEIKVSIDEKQMWSLMLPTVIHTYRRSLVESGKSKNKIKKEMKELKEFLLYLNADTFSRKKYEEYADNYDDGPNSWIIDQIRKVFTLGIASDDEYVDIMKYLLEKYGQYDDIEEKIDYLIKCIKNDNGDHVFNLMTAWGYSIDITENEHIETKDYLPAFYCQQYISAMFQSDLFPINFEKIIESDK